MDKKELSNGGLIVGDDTDIKVKDTDSVILSWHIAEDGKGIMLIGKSDEESIFQRPKPVIVFTSDKPVEILEYLGLELSE